MSIKAGVFLEREFTTCADEEEKKKAANKTKVIRIAPNIGNVQARNERKHLKSNLVSGTLLEYVEVRDVSRVAVVKLKLVCMRSTNRAEREGIEHIPIR